MSKQSTVAIFNENPLLGNTDMHNRPFAAQVSAAHPDAWARFVVACTRERAEQSGISTHHFKEQRFAHARNSHIARFEQFRQAA